MRRRTVWLSVLAMLVYSGMVPAVTVSSSLSLGGGFDWFTYSPVTTLTQDWTEANVGGVLGSPITNTVAEPGVAVPGFGLHGAGTGSDTTSPGIGGQNFDIEQAFYGFTGNSSGGILYVGVVTGFDPTGVRHGSTNYYAGDFFLNIGDQTVSPTAAYDVALGTAVAGPGPNLAANHAPPTVNEATSRLGSAWDLNQAWTASSVNVPQHVIASNPFRVGTGSAYTGNFEVAWLLDVLGNGSDHNLLQVAIELNQAQVALLDAGGFGAHWTMQCGNDLVPIQGSVTVPNAPVPEPATMLLLGMGMAGLAVRARRRA